MRVRVGVKGRAEIKARAGAGAGAGAGSRARAGVRIRGRGSTCEPVSAAPPSSVSSVAVCDAHDTASTLASLNGLK